MKVYKVKWVELERTFTSRLSALRLMLRLKMAGYNPVMEIHNQER